MRSQLGAQRWIVTEIRFREVQIMANQSAFKRPSRPTIDTVTDNVEPHTGVIDPAGLTNDPRPVLSGHGDAGSIIHVRVDSFEVGIVEVGAGGTWTYQLPQPLPDGLFRLSARASNAGMLSVPSQPYMIEVDVTPPSAPTIDHASADSAATLSGRAEPYSKVEVYADKTLLGTVTTGTDSRWTFPLPDGIAAGHHALTATATDSAGNVSQSSASFDYAVGSAQSAAHAVVDEAERDSGEHPDDRPIDDGTAARPTSGSSIAPTIDSGDNTTKLSLADVLSTSHQEELFRTDGGTQVRGMPEPASESNEGRPMSHDVGYTGSHNAVQDVDLMVQAAMQTTHMA
ncbi:Ig-like domain-containing protein [Burkholderia sp. 3C]